jgi:hypothetical protein
MALFRIVVSACTGTVLHRERTKPAGCGYVFHPNQEMRVTSMPSAVASSNGASAVPAASLEAASMQPDVCCSRNSALEDQIPSARNLSLGDLGQKLQGKHNLDNGNKLILVRSSVNVGDILVTLMAQYPLLMNWNGPLYVVYGADFDEYLHNSATTQHILKSLLLVDVLFSDQRRYISIGRPTDDWQKVGGMRGVDSRCTVARCPAFHVQESEW